jgi:Methyltransferase domain
MTMKRYLLGLYRLLKVMATHPRYLVRGLNTLPPNCSAYRFSRAYKDTASQGAGVSLSSSMNPLWDYFQKHEDGHGIWKWEHYFEIYHRHFSRFVGQKVNVLEVGIYSGGSLGMWRSYFGEKSHIYGVDIEEACRVYENDYTSVFIGDQADRAFWSTFRKSVEGIDIIIDDGGHAPEQQQITLEEMLPHLRPGGVYLCEDVHSVSNRFCGFVTGLASELNGMYPISGSLLESNVSPFQASIHSIHFYPYVVVIEKHGVSPTKLSAPKHGTKWQPFLGGT